MNIVKTTVTSLLIAFVLTTAIVPAAALDEPENLSIETRNIRDAHAVFVTCHDGWTVSFYQAIADHHLVSRDDDGTTHDMGLVAEGAPHFYGVSERSDACDVGKQRADDPVRIQIWTVHEPPIFPAFRIYDVQDAGSPTVVCTAGKKVRAVTATATYDVGYLDSDQKYHSFIDGGIRNVPFLRTSMSNVECS